MPWLKMIINQSPLGQKHRLRDIVSLAEHAFFIKDDLLKQLIMARNYLSDKICNERTLGTKHDRKMLKSQLVAQMPLERWVAFPFVALLEIS